jgi:hypothetical protein
MSVGRVSAKIPTSRKEREKWGTRRKTYSRLHQDSGKYICGCQ